MKNKIIVLQGVPASGKSTEAERLVKENNKYVIVSRDAIREAAGEYWVPEREDYVSEIEEFQVRAAIKNKFTPIIDATNLNPKTIEKWKTLSQELGVDIEFNLFDVDFVTALVRDKQREQEGKRAVGEKVLKRFFYKYFPDKMHPADNRPILLPDSSLPPCVICDIDGTIALNTGRSPYDYSKVSTDYCDPRMQQLLNILHWQVSENIPIIFLSGRDATEQCCRDTIFWLQKHFHGMKFHLLMRHKDDKRKDSIVKKELYENHIKGNYNVLCVLDDRNQVVDMWRKEGLLCLQVYYGDF